MQRGGAGGRGGAGRGGVAVRTAGSPSSRASSRTAAAAAPGGGSRGLLPPPQEFHLLLEASVHGKSNICKIIYFVVHLLGTFGVTIELPKTAYVELDFFSQ